MKRILLVSYYYPPYPFGGSLRFKSLFKHLKKKKHDVKLLTCGKNGYDSNEKIIYINDPFKRDNVKNGRVLLRSLNPFPDTMNAWSLKVTKFIEKNYEKYDKIIITAPPFSLPMILSFRHNKSYMEKFILDIRDILFDGTLRDYIFLYPKLFDKIIENKIIDKFTHLTTNVNNYSKILNARYGVSPEVILNSYDDEYEAKKMKLKHPAYVYTGKIDRIRFNNSLFEGFKEFLKENKGFLYIAGEDKESLLRKYLSENIEYLGILSRETSEDLIYSSDVCLIMHKFDIKDADSVFSYKVTDYAKYGKPIVYVGPSTDISEFIKMNNIGICINTFSAKDISSALSKALKLRFDTAGKLFKDTFIGTSLDL
ncbi:MAG: hypothetical protein COX48_03500 [bacterium (Candidatus Stahlbacteria) CG23_combo_of_CG06-09_8_20_14_all_34_7]|nr:MAG: hypothetical protein COX48_03500 [bacterium (Candidatus Stahlbacteria) CG23_combo_of_CG06-09_8_20_14_all_34_7]